MTKMKMKIECKLWRIPNQDLVGQDLVRKSPKCALDILSFFLVSRNVFICKHDAISAAYIVMKGSDPYAG